MLKRIIIVIASTLAIIFAPYFSGDLFIKKILLHDNEVYIIPIWILGFLGIGALVGIVAIIISIAIAIKDYIIEGDS